MALNNKTTLKSQAQTIRREDGEGKNTAERVGKVLEEIVDNVDASLTSETQARQTADTNLQNTLNSAVSIANNAQSTANAAKTSAANAQSTANSAKTTAEAAKAVTDTKGHPGGLAELDDNGKVPSSQLPGYVDDVVEFNAMVSGVTPQMASSTKKANDPGCMVVYDQDRDTFLLAVSNRSILDSDDWNLIKRPVISQSVITPHVEAGELQQQVVVSDYWLIEDGAIVIKPSAFTYYNNWADGDSFGTGTSEGRVPEAGKIYTCTSDNKTFRWSGSELITIGSDLALGRTASSAFPGDAGAQLEETVGYHGTWITQNDNHIKSIGILPCDGQWDGKGAAPTSGVWLIPSEAYEGALCFESYGNTDFYGYAPEVYNSDEQYNPGYIYRIEDGLFRIENNKLVSIAGSAVGNTYNATVEIPLPTGEYYSDIMAEKQTHNVLKAVFAEGKASLGLTITFAIGPASWKTYQYVGPNTTEDQFVKNTKNWIDMAGMSAGSEPIINVDALCSRSEQGLAGYYTRDTAIDAVLAKQNESGITYAKEGLILTYRVAEYKWEAIQFQGAISDFATKDANLWKPFGSGGSDVKTSDTPENKGKDAFSTGGAYDMQQASFDHLDLDQDESDWLVKAVNHKGDEMGDPIHIPKATGGGTQSGSTLSIYLENPAIYAAFGSDIVAMAAIKSASYDGDTEVLGVIRRIEIVDATTGLSLWSENVNENSSTSATNYKFKFDFTPYFTEAAQRDFTIVAQDADGNIKRRTITVTAVDVTCECPQPLNYTTASTLTVGGSPKNLLMYAFRNNVSKQGVKVRVEILWNGTWKKLGEESVLDSYSHSISIDPSNVFGGGEKMVHASYPLRIQGEDIASGVKGNTIYTSVMCIDPNSTQPVVSIRYNDANNGVVRLYDNMDLQVAAYTPGKNSTTAEVYFDGKEVTSIDCQIGQSYTVRKQIQGYASDGSKSVEAYAKSGSVQTNTIKVTVVGSAISAIIKEGALFGFDFASRSNSEPDHTIANNGYNLLVEGANYSSNGFIPYLGEMALRFAENVKGTIPAYAPFGSVATERTNGMALQFAFATNNVKDDDAKLMECYDPNSGAGFYVCGNKVVVCCKNGTPSQITRSFKCGEKHTAGIVVEPSIICVNRGGIEYSTIKFYMDGEEIGAIGYVANSGAILNTCNIKFDGTSADFYLYYALAYDSYYEWAQAFQNYLCKLTDTSKMIKEFDAENVLDNQNRPSLDKLKEKNIPYYVVVASQETFDSFDSDIDTSTKFECTLFYFDPARPWRSFKATNVQWRRQGTTSAKRPIKNDRFYLRKPAIKGHVIEVTPLNPEYTTEDALKTYELMKLGYIRVGLNTIPVAIITVKVDYSDSSMANDCGVCDMMNATFRALGSDYLTPAQRAFDGTWENKGVKVTGLQMNHSTANHLIAAFRATNDSLTDAWFHSRGNWKEDKGEQVALGFMDTPGYNKGCRNYGDFKEFFGKATFDAAGKFQSQETLTQIMARFRATEGLDTSQLYLLSQYCGRDYIFMRYEGGEWKRCTGSMKQVNGKWQITGDVLNPVSGYELITYDAMDWFMGVGSIDDMMAPTTTESSWVTKLKLKQPTYPAWTQYFECMIDDDQLQEDLAMGRKVPYELYNVMKFCDSCDYSKEALADTWGNIWKQNAWKYMSIQSLLAYYLFTDYLAAVDQQAKNMQPMFFLEDGCSVENGVYSSPSAMEPIRMYFNKVYDCDTCNGKDNDGGNTIPAELNPEEDDKCYAGRGSILWNNLRRCENQEMVANASGTTLTLPGVASTMRNLPEVEGIGAGPFSPKGALYYFVQKRIEAWPKLVCSFDCEHKYIDYTGYNDIYYYALHGSGRQSLPRFIEQRWRVRDGYYQTGDFKDASHVLGGRIGAKTGAVIKFKAAKDGYFGIGNDGGNVTQGMYLKAGEEGIFTDFQHGDNILLYIYQADRMSEIDLSQISLDPNFQFSVMSLAEKIVIGSVNHKTAWRLSPGNTGFLETMNLGELPFLRHLDVRNTEIRSINAAKCPRLEVVLASGSDLSSITTAETSPLETLELPAGMTELNFVNLPNLTYPGGLTIASMTNVNRLMLAGCPNIDPMALINGIVTASGLRYLRLPNVNITAPSSILKALRQSGAVGLDPTGQAYEESGQCSGVTGRWIMEDLIDDSELSKTKSGSLAAYFPQLELHNAQYSAVMFDDTVNDTQNITNLDNKTTGDEYEPSGHFIRIRDNSHAYKCTYDISDANEPKMLCEQLSDANYGLMADGSDIDLADFAGVGYDIMKRLQPYWYKGVNDFKNQRKYFFVSSLDDEPLSTSGKTNRKKLSECLRQALTCIITANQVEGNDMVTSENTNHNLYAIDVEGMKQVRWPGVNSAQVGAVFLDASGKVISTFNMSVGNSLFDFVLGDYIFCDVPKGAKTFMFSAPTGYDTLEAIAVDSDAIEAIEPDWVHAEERLVGVYGMSIDSLMRPRSISGAVTKRGDGTSQTNPDWKYNNEGKLTNQTVPTSTLHYTCKDFMNICEMRGAGFMAIDYEISKDIANLVMALIGDRDVQAQCGYGCSSGYTTGANNFNSYGNVTRKGTSGGNIIYGIQNFVGCNSEWMDNIAANVPSVAQFKKDKCVAQSSYPIDAKYHIVWNAAGDERVVQGINTNGYCIGRVKFGRFCDVIASRTTTDNSKWNQNYSDCQWYSHDRGRVVLRSYGNANANGGLVCSNAFYVSSYSYTLSGSRLAFRGKIVIVKPEA